MNLRKLPYLSLVFVLVVAAFLAWAPQTSAAPSLSVSPDPLTIHLGSAPRVPFGTRTQITFVATDFEPSGSLYVRVAGSFTATPTCSMNSSTVTCGVPIPYIGLGTYSIVTTYIPRYANQGQTVSVTSTLIVAP